MYYKKKITRKRRFSNKLFISFNQLKALYMSSSRIETNKTLKVYNYYYIRNRDKAEIKFQAIRNIFFY